LVAKKGFAVEDQRAVGQKSGVRRTARTRDELLARRRARRSLHRETVETRAGVEIVAEVNELILPRARRRRRWHEPGIHDVASVVGEPRSLAKSAALDLIHLVGVTTAQRVLEAFVELLVRSTRYPPDRAVNSERNERSSVIGGDGAERV